MGGFLVPEARFMTWYETKNYENQKKNTECSRFKKINEEKRVRKNVVLKKIEQVKVFQRCSIKKLKLKTFFF